MAEKQFFDIMRDENWIVGDLDAAVESGNLEKSLLALRKFLTRRLQVAHSRDVSSISKELRDVLTAIEEMKAPVKGEGKLESLREQQRQRLDRIAAAPYSPHSNDSPN